MTGRNRALFLIPLLTIFAGSELSRDRPQHGKHGLVITGTAIGYDELAPLANLTSAPQIDILIVRVAKRISGTEESKYIKVVYQHLHGQPDLPTDIVDSRRQWVFALTKAPADDVTCKGPLKQVKHALGAEAEQLHDDASLPCYVLRPGDLKAQESANK